MKTKYAELAGFTPDDASDIGIRMKTLAGEIYSLESAVEWLRRETFPQTATGPRLDLRAAERGIARKGAGAATGTLTFGRSTALWMPTSVPAGTVCATSGVDSAHYVTTADAVLPAGQLTVDVPAKAEEAGASGNTLAGTVTVMVTPPVSMESVTNKVAFTGGGDAESDDSLRARLLDRWGEPGNGTNAAWYRQMAESCDGVFSANVVPRANGAGTVAVYLGGVGCAASADAVSAVQALLTAKKEISVDVTVAAAQTLSVDVTCAVKPKAGYSFTEAKQAVWTATADYFRTLGVGETVVLSALALKIFASGCTDDCTFSTSNVTPAANQLAVPGTQVVTEVT